MDKWKHLNLEVQVLVPPGLVLSLLDPLQTQEREADFLENSITENKSPKQRHIL